MEVLCRKIPVTTYSIEVFTLEEVKESILTHKPSELIIIEYSADTPCMYINEISEEGVTYRWHASSNKEFIPATWEKFYSVIRQYLARIIFRSNTTKEQ